MKMPPRDSQALLCKRGKHHWSRWTRDYLVGVRRRHCCGCGEMETKAL